MYQDMGCTRTRRVPGHGVSNCVIGGMVVFMSHVLPCRPADGSPYTARPGGTAPQKPKPWSCGVAAIANPPRTPSVVNLETAEEFTGVGRAPVSLLDVSSIAWRLWKAPGPNQACGTVPVRRLQDTSSSVRFEKTPSWAHSTGSSPVRAGKPVVTAVTAVTVVNQPRMEGSSVLKVSTRTTTTTPHYHMTVGATRETPQARLCCVRACNVQIVLHLQAGFTDARLYSPRRRLACRTVGPVITACTPAWCFRIYCIGSKSRTALFTCCTVLVHSLYQQQFPDKPAGASTGLTP